VTAIVGFALVATGCGSNAASELGATETAGVYFYLAEEDEDAGDLWDPLTMCADDPPCKNSGFLPGVTLQLSARHQDAGWGIKIVFDPESSDDDRERSIERLTERALDLGIDPPMLLVASERWPSCEGQAECLTVAETLTDG